MLELKPSDINGYYAPADPGEPVTGEQRLSVNDQEAEIVSLLCRGADVLEIGTGLGVSTRAIAKRARRVWTVDIDTFVQTNVHPLLPINVLGSATIPDKLTYDVVFIDGAHNFEDASRDLQRAALVLRPGGVIIAHDLYIEQVAGAILETGWPFVHIQTYAGLALIWPQ